MRTIQVRRTEFHRRVSTPNRELPNWAHASEGFFFTIVALAHHARERYGAELCAVFLAALTRTPREKHIVCPSLTTDMAEKMAPGIPLLIRWECRGI